MLFLILAMGCLSIDAAPESHWTPGVLVLTPEPKMIDITQRAVDKWRTALTGLDIHVGQAGVPVFSVPIVRDDRGKSVCGMTTVVDSERRVDRIASVEISADVEYCFSKERVLIHEIAHALTPDAPYGYHAKAGVFAAEANAGPPEVDQAAIDAVCEIRGCHVIADSVGTGPE